MSPIAWAMQPLKKYANFSGRAPRAEFWWFFLFIFILYFVVSFVFVGSLGGLAASGAEPSAGMASLFGGAGLFILLFWLALLIPTIAVQVRRLHDTNRSGWWIGAFYLLYAVYMVFAMGAVFSAAAGAVDPEASGMGMLAGAGIFGIIMLIYTIVLLVFYCLPGTRGPNRFGPDPYGEQNLDEVFA